MMKLPARLTRIRYADDCLRIQQALIGMGYYVTLKKAQRLWRAHSETFCAGWLGLPQADHDLVYELQQIVEERE